MTPAAHSLIDDLNDFKNTIFSNEQQGRIDVINAITVGCAGGPESYNEINDAYACSEMKTIDAIAVHELRAPHAFKIPPTNTPTHTALECFPSTAKQSKRALRDLSVLESYFPIPVTLSPQVDGNSLCLKREASALPDPDLRLLP